MAPASLGHFDAVGVHTDIPCELRAPERYVRDPGGLISRWAFLGYRSLHDVMLREGVRAPLWMSELGWATSDAPCPNGVWTGKKVAGVSEADQARFLPQAYACLATDPYVKVALWFTLQDSDLLDERHLPARARQAIGQRPAQDAGADDDRRAHRTHTFRRARPPLWARSSARASMT